MAGAAEFSQRVTAEGRTIGQARSTHAQGGPLNFQSDVMAEAAEFSGAFPLGVTAQHLMSATLSGPRHKRSLCFLLRPRSASSPRFGWWLPVVVTSVWRGRGPPGSLSPLGPPVSFQTQAHIASTSVPVCLTTTLTPLFFRIQAVLSTSLPVPSFNASALQCDPSLPAHSSTLVTTHSLLDVWWKVGFLVLGVFGRHSIP
ncbi:uncharacterized protein LACBIDRAFT_335115 [Laccaria bicolor S238N-H82]|uniref:Predicted protein n=1 Tax=Laccaria bicolor (strain S238N-H82 / ATCC MYA-4686) TaxID=486041 RepID=B0E1E8_LACBS|nr:uncharacterized protein LACBIDRAFT_335115 [Laccaria bicolor S238N-H82]EDQ99318.1 predicted protein [Laccaria bicolor S238N-H82]|eukprot:XP_001890038.1 predicted protein [Laccaria bicolor S238N-H82]